MSTARRIDVTMVMKLPDEVNLLSLLSELPYATCSPLRISLTSFIQFSNSCSYNPCISQEAHDSTLCIAT